MEFLSLSIGLLLFGSLLATPIILIRLLKPQKNLRKKVIYFTVCFLLMAALVYISAWWSNQSKIILLDFYGYHFNPMKGIDKYQDVSMENLDRVKHLESSIMGIGWTVKAMFLYIAVVPYMFIINFGSIVVRKLLKSSIKKNK